MSFKNMLKVIASLAMLAVLAGCTVTGEPRSKNVAFDGDGYIVATEEFENSIKIGEVTNFPGTNPFGYTDKVNPNFSNKSFKAVLEESLKNANLYGEGYTLSANLIDSGNWPTWGVMWGEQTRRIEIEYTIKDRDEIVFQETIVSDIAVDVNEVNFTYLEQRKVAEVNYADNIKQLIEKINKL